MNVIFLTIFLVILTFTIECPENCENGYCNDKGFCVCDPGYFGGDCSLRVCPFGEALQVSPLGDLNGDGIIDNSRVHTELYPNGMGIKEWDENEAKDRPHSYRECSNAGNCDRVKGVCKCREGFEGSACQRRKCRPNDSVKDCNGRGICVGSDDYIRIATQGSSGSNSWELKKYNRCLCDNGWKGIYCDKRSCNKGYDPKYYKTLFQFGYTLLDSEGKNPPTSADGDTGTVSHYLEFTYLGMNYRTPTIDSYKGLCNGGSSTNPPGSKPGKLNVDLGILFKEELKKKLRHLPYFTPVDIELSCTGDKTETISSNTITKSNTHSDGNFVTVVLTLDYIDITPILLMELNVYKNEKKDSALLYGIERAVYGKQNGGFQNEGSYGTFQSTGSQAVWLMKFESLISNGERRCYSNHRLESGYIPTYPLDIATECKDDSLGNKYGMFNIYPYQRDKDALGFPVPDQLECSGKGICDESKGICKCVESYYGSACNRIANYQ